MADKKVIGYSFSGDITAKKHYYGSIKRAIKTRGVQYAGKEFTSLLERH